MALAQRFSGAVLALAAAPALAAAQLSTPAADSAAARRDSVQRLRAIEVSAQAAFASGPVPDVTGTALAVGKKSERITMSLVDGAKTANSMRQVFGRSPGIFVFELDGSGIQDGIAARGLSPNRSWEFNTRQDGVDITPDPFGYPEAYYTPAFESLERVEIVRGAASLQYGPQFGGLLNYITKRGSADRKVAVEATQMSGANGLYAGYAGVGGTVGATNYYGYANYRQGDGWRENNDYDHRTFHLSGSSQLPSAGRLGFQLTYENGDIRTPGGLTEQQFAGDSRRAYRNRDWFGTPWFIPVVTYDHALGQRTSLSVKGFGLVAERNSVGLQTAASVADSGTNPRRVNQDRYRSAGAELRVVRNFELLSRPSAIAGGVRASRGHTDREVGRGAEGGDFDMRTVAPLVNDLEFTTRNLAAFSEAKLAVTNRLSVAPGVRVEQIRATGRGEAYRSNSRFERASTVNQFQGSSATETVPLFGVGASFALTGAEVYGNVAQAYRPVLFSDQFPNELVAVDPSLRSARGVSSDVGVRGTLGRVLTYDVSGFYLLYGDRVGTLPRGVLGADSVLFPGGLRKNIGESRHYGLESYAELDAVRLLGGEAVAARFGSTLLFTSLGRTVARYTDGPLAGNQVEYSPDLIVRGGVTYRLRDRLSATVQGSSVGSAYADASNVARNATGAGGSGPVPAYSVWDVAGRVRLARGLAFEASLNNAFDKRYFTRRTGTGIAPADGRTVIAGLRLTTPGVGR